MRKKQLIYILIFAVVLIGIAAGFVFIFQDLSEREEFAETVKEDRVYRFVLEHGTPATAASYQGSLITHGDRLITADDGIYEVTDVQEENGTTYITYTNQGTQGTLSQDELAELDIVDIRSARRLTLAGLQLDSVSLENGTKIEDSRGQTYTVSGIFSSGGAIEVTYISDEGDPYSLVLSHESDSADNSYTTDDGIESVTVSMTTAQAQQTLEQHTNEIEQAISDLESEVEQARAEGDEEKAQAAEEKITELEEEITTAEDEVLTLVEDEEETVDQDSTQQQEQQDDGMLLEQEEPTDSQESTTEQDVQESTSETTTANPTVLDETEDEEESQTPPATEEQPISGEQEPVSETSYINEEEYELFYDEDQQQWDIDWGVEAVRLIP